MTQDNTSAAARTQAEAPHARPIAELSIAFPNHDLIHEIQVRGACTWQTLIPICEMLRRAQATLQSLAARRYGDKGELITCRVGNLDDLRLQDAIDAVRRLPGVQAVTVTHLLCKTRPGSDTKPAD